MNPNVWDRTEAMVDSLLDESEFDGKYIVADGGAVGLTDANKDSVVSHFFRSCFRIPVVWSIGLEKTYSWGHIQVSPRSLN